MITIYKSSETGLITLDQHTSGSWVNVVNPTAQELDELQQLGIPQDYLTYPLDLDERARTERENDEVLIVLRIPYYQGQSVDIPYTTLPLGIVLAEDYVLTISRFENEITREMISGRLRNLPTHKRNRFVLRILLATATKYLAYLREITKAVDILEDQLTKSTRNKEVLELLKYQKSLTHFSTALKSNELMMERLHRSRIFQTYPDDEDLLEDVLTENQQAIEMNSITSNILSSMMDAFASIISNNLNGVMKFLASVTILVSLPQLVASLFGMNVHLPFENTPLAFLFIILISLLIGGAATYIFWKRDWF
jgi:magnesium transporter